MLILNHDHLEHRQRYVTRLDLVDSKKVRPRVEEFERRRMTVRDHELMVSLRELHTLSLNQITRLLWPTGQAETARRRLSLLTGYYLVGRADTPDRLAAYLPNGQVYILGPGGWLHLDEELTPERMRRHLCAGQVLRDLILAEIYTRMVEGARRHPLDLPRWVGDEELRLNKDVTPSALIVAQQPSGNIGAMFFEMELEGEPGLDWRQKILGYDCLRLADNWKAHSALEGLAQFPDVMILTASPEAKERAIDQVKQHRLASVLYRVALVDDIMANRKPGWTTLLPPKA